MAIYVRYIRKHVLDNLLVDSKLDDQAVYLWCIQNSLGSKRLLRRLKHSKDNELVNAVLAVIEDELKKSDGVRKRLSDVIRQFERTDAPKEET